jgi:ParB-like chromosome segregation protein Spo0J
MTVAVQGVRDIPVADLTPFPGNPRRGNTAEIRASIRRLGQYRTVVVRDTGDTLTILAGNHTVQALQAEGHQTARCEIIQCDDDEARRVNLADNRLAELGGYDDDALVEILSYLDDDYEGTGWTEEDVRKLIDVPDFEPEDDSPRLDELEPRPCPKCGYDTANDPEALKVT